MMMRSLLIISLGFMLAAMPAWAEAGDNDNQFRTFNEITQALNPLDVIANHDGIKRSIDLQIQFKLDSSELLPAAQRQIKALAKAVNSERLNGYKIQIVGHTDTLGDAGHNQWLSESRANAVLSALVAEHNVNKKRLESMGKGENDLLDGLAEHDAKHRRVEIIAIATTQQQAKHYSTRDEHAPQTSGEHKAIAW